MSPIRALRLAYPAYPSTTLCVWELVLAVGYGTLNEVHQAFTPGHTVGPLDVFADAARASVVASVWRSMGPRWLTLPG